MSFLFSPTAEPTHRPTQQPTFQAMSSSQQVDPSDWVGIGGIIAAVAVVFVVFTCWYVYTSSVYNKAVREKLRSDGISKVINAMEYLVSHDIETGTAGGAVAFANRELVHSIVKLKLNMGLSEIEIAKERGPPSCTSTCCESQDQVRNRELDMLLAACRTCTLVSLQAQKKAAAVTGSGSRGGGGSSSHSSGTLVRPHSTSNVHHSHYQSQRHIQAQRSRSGVFSHTPTPPTSGTPFTLHNEKQQQTPSQHQQRQSGHKYGYGGGGGGRVVSGHHSRPHSLNLSLEVDSPESGESGAREMGERVDSFDEDTKL